MNNVPRSNRKHITIFGKTNSGKSSLFNAILGTDTAIISDKEGTTTDPVVKSMELIPYGPIVLTDTAGLFDKTELGEMREKKTIEIMERTDFAIYTIDVNDYDGLEYEKLKNLFEKYKIPYIVTITKSDLLGEATIEGFLRLFDNACTVSVNDRNSVGDFKEMLARLLKESENEDENLIRGLVEEGGNVLLVIPIDSEAPKGRLILPQVQMIRDCLDCGIRCCVTTVEGIKKSLEEYKRIDLVITDSQVFKKVDEILPKDIKLTSFSILMARQKGDIKRLTEGVKAFDELDDGDTILIAESCTHTKNHEDIGTVKIPNGLKKVTGKELNFEFSNGHDYPEDIEKYKMVIHCGGCMMTSREMRARIRKNEEKSVPITNYGITLAYISGILERSIEILR
ncbi:MAG: [Firmicutes bacterium]|nr:[FeFe] hydrogenase H-cluster maturation GTPase HydF [Bacillota bacterium]